MSNNDILDDILDTVDEFVECDDYCRYSDNCEVFGYISNRKKLKVILIELLKSVDINKEIDNILDKMMVDEI